MKQGLAPERTAPAPSPEADTVALLLRCTERNAHTIAALFPEESGDFIRGYTAGQVDAFRLALDHIKDLAARKNGQKKPGAERPA